MIPQFPTGPKEHDEPYNTVGTANKLASTLINGERCLKTSTSKDYVTLQANATTQLDTWPITESENTMWRSDAGNTETLSLAIMAEPTKEVISE